MGIEFLNNFDWQPLLLTFKLSLITTLVLVVIGIPIAYFMAFYKGRFKAFIEAFISMPIVLPPTVLGFYLLIAFNPNTILGGWLDKYVGIQLAFSFTGIVLGSVIYSLPFMVQPIQNAFQSLSKSYIDTAKILGKTRWEILRYVIVPNSKSAIISAIVLTFAHTIGEFGVVLMLGGSIPGKTKVASIAIYEKVEALRYEEAHQYAFILFIISFSILTGIYSYNKSNWSLFKPSLKK